MFLQLIIAVTTPLLVAQQPSVSFERYSLEDGLSGPVMKIVRDNYGFLWLGTKDGLNRFDGKNFVVYRNITGDSLSLTNNIINNLFVDSQNRVWIATNGGVCYYDFTKDEFTTVSFEIPLEKIDRHRIYTITADESGLIWFASRTYIHKYNTDQTISSYRVPGPSNLIIKDLVALPQGSIGIGTNLGFLTYKISDDTFRTHEVTSPFSMERKLPVSVHPLVFKGGDTLLTGSWYAGLQQIIITKDTILSTAVEDHTETDLRRHIVTAISRKSDHEWWVGTYGNGLSVYDEQKEKFTNHYHHDPSSSKSLSNNYINYIFTDPSGIVWVGTNNGLDKFDPLSQQFVTVPVPLSSQNFAIYRTPSCIIQDPDDSRHLWICVSGGGLYYYNMYSGKFKIYNHHPDHPSSLPDDNVYEIYYDSKDRIWVGTRTGVRLFDKKNNRFVIPPGFRDLMPKGVHTIFEDSKQKVWFVTYSNGIFCFDDHSGAIESIQYHESDSNSLIDNRVFCMIESRTGLFWIGTQNRGVCVLNPESGKIISFQHTRNMRHTVPDNGIYDLYEDDEGFIWIATENGLGKMNPHTYECNTYTTSNGLSSNIVFSITPDAVGNLWMGTNNGLSYLNTTQEVFRNFYITDGLPVNRIDGSVYMAPSGKLFLGTAEAISYCIPDEMKMNMIPPPVIITSFKIWDQPIKLTRNQDRINDLKLSYRQNMITIDFSALNFTSPTLNRYAYKLEGFDQDWIHPLNNQSATYTNLNPGEYTFRVKASNNDGIWNDEGDFFVLTVSPPFWNTWWFYILCFLCFISIVYGIYRFRVKQILRLHDIRAGISRDLHDDIGSTLSSIIILSGMAARGVATPEISSGLFNTISNASHQAMELMSDIVWSINPENDLIDRIVARMRQFASETLESANITVVFETGDNNSSGIPIEKRRDLFLIFKEVINNIAKYSNASQVHVSLLIKNHRVSLIIKDNGIGFDENTIMKGNGINNIKSRARRLKGELKIQTSTGHGTAVYLTFPL